MLDVTVKRSEWGKAVLYDPQSKKRCCLGFVGNACGITDDEMRCVGTPSTLLKVYGLNILDSLIKKNDTQTLDSRVANKLMAVNDARDFEPSLRESEIASIGKEAGINFTFVD